MVAPGTVMLEVGLSATFTTMSWPEEIPPSTPPALLLLNPVGVSSSRCSDPSCATALKPAPISTPFTALMPIMAPAKSASSRSNTGSATPAAVVAKPVFLLIGVVGVTGAKPVLDLVVVARALILILDHEADRRAGGAAFEDARQDAHRVGFAPLSGEWRSAWAAPLHIRLQIRLAQGEPRRTAVDHAAQCRAVTFAEARDREYPAERISRHA